MADNTLFRWTVRRFGCESRVHPPGFIRRTASGRTEEVGAEMSAFWSFIRSAPECRPHAGMLFRESHSPVTCVRVKRTRDCPVDVLQRVRAPEGLDEASLLIGGTNLFSVDRRNQRIHQINIPSGESRLIPFGDGELVSACASPAGGLLVLVKLDRKYVCRRLEPEPGSVVDLSLDFAIVDPSAIALGHDGAIVIADKQAHVLVEVSERGVRRAGCRMSFREMLSFAGAPDAGRASSVLSQVPLEYPSCLCINEHGMLTVDRDKILFEFGFRLGVLPQLHPFEYEHAVLRGLAGFLLGDHATLGMLSLPSFELREYTMSFEATSLAVLPDGHLALLSGPDILLLKPPAAADPLWRIPVNPVTANAVPRDGTRYFDYLDGEDTEHPGISRGCHAPPDDWLTDGDGAGSDDLGSPFRTSIRRDAAWKTGLRWLADWARPLANREAILAALAEILCSEPVSKVEELVRTARRGAVDSADLHALLGMLDQQARRRLWMTLHEWPSRPREHPRILYSGLTCPTRIALAEGEALWVVERSEASVLRLHGDERHVFGRGDLGFASGLLVHGSLYVCDMGNHRICRLQHDGTFETVRMDAGEQIHSIRRADSGGLIYALDLGLDKIRVLDSQWMLVNMIEGPDGEPFTQLIDVAVRRDGNLVVVERGTNPRLQMITPSGQRVGVVRRADWAPQFLTLDPDDNLYVTDQPHGCVWCIAADLSIRGVIGTGYLKQPNGIAWRDGRLVVADSAAGSILELSVTAGVSPEERAV